MRFERLRGQDCSGARANCRPHRSKRSCSAAGRQLSGRGAAFGPRRAGSHRAPGPTGTANSPAPQHSRGLALQDQAEPTPTAEPSSGSRRYWRAPRAQAVVFRRPDDRPDGGPLICRQPSSKCFCSGPSGRLTRVWLRQGRSTDRRFQSAKLSQQHRRAQRRLNHGFRALACSPAHQPLAVLATRPPQAQAQCTCLGDISSD